MLMERNSQPLPPVFISAFQVSYVCVCVCVCVFGGRKSHWNLEFKKCSFDDLVSLFGCST